MAEDKLTQDEIDSIRQMVDGAKSKTGEPSSPNALTAEEIRWFREHIKELTKIVENEQRVKWLYSSLRIWSAWIAGAIVGAYSLYEVISKVLKSKGL